MSVEQQRLEGILATEEAAATDMAMRAAASKKAAATRAASMNIKKEHSKTSMEALGSQARSKFATAQEQAKQAQQRLNEFRRVKEEINPGGQPETEPEIKPGVEPEIMPGVEPEIKTKVKPEIKTKDEPEITGASPKKKVARAPLVKAKAEPLIKQERLKSSPKAKQVVVVKKESGSEQDEQAGAGQAGQAGRAEQDEQDEQDDQAATLTPAEQIAKLKAALQAEQNKSEKAEAQRDQALAIAAKAVAKTQGGARGYAWNRHAVGRKGVEPGRAASMPPPGGRGTQPPWPIPRPRGSAGGAQSSQASASDVSMVSMARESFESSIDGAAMSVSLPSTIENIDEVLESEPVPQIWRNRQGH